MTGCRSNYQPYPIYTTLLTGKNLPSHLGYRGRAPPCVVDVASCRPTSSAKANRKLIQTVFRESETQTDPYAVEVAETSNKALEIFTLGWLSRAKGLPAGINEIRTIERARQKRAWEAALPVPFDETAISVRAAIIEGIETNEWAYREELILEMNSLRMELAEKLMKERCRQFKVKYESRLKKYAETKKEEKSKQMQKVRVNFNRNMRKLMLARQKVDRKYRRWNVIEQFANKTSELYAAQMRFGEDPRHWHEKIEPECGYWRAFRRLEIMHHTMADIPGPLIPAFDFKKKSKPVGNNNELCIRVTKWTEANLQVLHDELRKIRKRRHIAPTACYLKKKFYSGEIELHTPTVDGIPDEEEESFQACLFLQKTVKGRAIQAVMFEGRVKCQELIEELKSTHALQNRAEDVKAQTRKRVYGLQRQAELEEIKEKRINEILCGLEGKTTGDMLDFLAKELQRLENERTTHALALLADQERHKREAAEAGRRQAEELRRREHDEMFKQTLKLHQNTVQAVIQDVLLDNTQWLAHREAREYITELAEQFDRDANQTALAPLYWRSSYLKDEEIIAELVHNFALPEAEKRIVRKRLNDKQRNYLKICHDEVYSNIDKAVLGPRKEDGKLLSLPITGKHKIPPLVSVKYMNLKRMHESSSSSLDTKSSKNSGSIINEVFASHQEVKVVPQEPPVPQDEEIWSSGYSKQEVILHADNNEVDNNNDADNEDTDKND